ncbi:MAG: hypothetical protein KGY61_06610 [Desulfobacterales bacterium]|nr:hypothetical protein [Desulfobacterales bacterium]
MAGNGKAEALKNAYESVLKDAIITVAPNLNIIEAKAARLVGISRKTMYQKIKKHDIPLENPKRM